MPNLNTPVNAFKSGNQLYKLAPYTVRNKLFATPDDLLAAAFDYFDWVENNPVIEEVLVNGQTFPLPNMRAMTLEPLCIHIGVCNLRHYKKMRIFLTSFHSFTLQLRLIILKVLLLACLNLKLLLVSWGCKNVLNN